MRGINLQVWAELLDKEILSGASLSDAAKQADEKYARLKNEYDHTPGPWMVKFRSDGSCYISMGNPRSGPHKQFDLMLEAGRENDEIDARLIASAPDLFRVLVGLESATKYADRVNWRLQARAIIERVTNL